MGSGYGVPSLGICHERRLRGEPDSSTGGPPRETVHRVQQRWGDRHHLSSHHRRRIREASMIRSDTLLSGILFICIIRVPTFLSDFPFCFHQVVPFSGLFRRNIYQRPNPLFHRRCMYKSLPFTICIITSAPHCSFVNFRPWVSSFRSGTQSVRP